MKSSYTEEKAQRAYNEAVGSINSGYVETAIRAKAIDKRYGEIFNRLFSLRMTGDYQDRRNLDLDSDVIPLVEPAKQLITVTSEMAEENIRKG